MLGIEKRIRLIISVVFDMNQDLIKNDSSINNVLEWDSMNPMNLIYALEEEFKFYFDEIENNVSFEIMKITIKKNFSFRN